jgi:hypothetical protein
MYASVPDYRTLSDTDDNSAYALAVASGMPVYFPAGQGLGADGAYLVDTPWGTNNVTSGLQLIGDGIGRSIIRRTDARRGPNLFYNSGSANPDDNLVNLLVRDLTLEDDPGREIGFTEHEHLVHINGVSDTIFQRVEFKGFLGDGLYLGSSHILGQERHNRRIIVRDCIFDGVDNENRNGISVLDVDGLSIEDCEFRHCTKLDGSMPGAIDLEPDVSNLADPPTFFRYAIIRNVRIVNNSFQNCGGNALALLLPSLELDNQVENIIIERNRVVDCRGALAFSGYAGTDAASSVRKWGVQFIGNHVRGCTLPFYIFIDGAFGLLMERNTFEDCGFVQLGFASTSRHMRIQNNNFIRCGGGDAIVFVVDKSLIDVWIEDNHFLDCAYFILFIRGASANFSRVRFNRNRIEGASTGAVLAQVGPLGTWTGTVDGECQAVGNMVAASIWDGNNVSFNGPSLSYSNGWVSYGGDSAPVVRKDDSDIVTVTGAVKSGTVTAGTIMFTLPVGYRPVATYRAVTSSVGSVARIQVNRNGSVATLSGVASGDCHLNLAFAARPGT